MKLKIMVGALALALGPLAVASAQGTSRDSGPGHGGGFRRGPGGEQMMLLQGITLTDAQQANLKKLQASHAAEMKELFGSANGQRPDREKMRGLREKQQQEVRAMLTSDQQAIYDKNVADMKAKMQQRMQHRDNHQ